MLFIDDIQLFFCLNDFQLSKENKFNYVHYSIFFKKTRIISFEQNFNKIWMFKVYVFVMF
jgi:Mg2+ and Co2+ transporter CorA